MLQFLQNPSLIWNRDIIKQFCLLITNNRESHEEMRKLHLYSSFYPQGSWHALENIHVDAYEHTKST